MHRRAVIELLAAGAATGTVDPVLAARFRDFVLEHEDCLERTCVPGHITASAWILSADRGSCLLTRHRKLDRWLQLGGHVDGEGALAVAALRESVEESGLQHFDLLSPAPRVLPLDLDVHPIPARGSEPAHLHWDVRFLLIAGAGQRIAMSNESLDLRWVPRERLRDCTQEDSVLRLDARAASWERGRLFTVAPA